MEALFASQRMPRPQTKINLVLAVRCDVGLLGSLAAIQSGNRQRDRLKSQQRLVELPKRFEPEALE